MKTLNIVNKYKENVFISYINDLPNCFLLSNNVKEKIIFKFYNDQLSLQPLPELYKVKS